jgi:hypothetical protein
VRIQGQGLREKLFTAEAAEKYRRERRERPIRLSPRALQFLGELCDFLANFAVKGFYCCGMHKRFQAQRAPRKTLGKAFGGCMRDRGGAGGGRRTLKERFSMKNELSNCVIK